MLEIYIIYRLTKYVGRIAEQKNLKKLRYQVMSVFLWIIGELTGVLLAGILLEETSFGSVYGFGLAGAFIGAIIAFLVMRFIPEKNIPSELNAQNVPMDEGFSWQKLAQSALVPVLVTLFAVSCLCISFLGGAVITIMNAPLYTDVENIPHHDPYELEDIYLELRTGALNTKSDQIDLDVAKDEPFGVLMEVGIESGIFTLSAFSTGDASLYFSTGGGILGGIGHENVREVSKQFIEESRDFLEYMELVDEYPLPEYGRVRFYIITDDGVWGADYSESEIAKRGHLMAPLYYAADDLVTELRIISESQSE